MGKMSRTKGQRGEIEVRNFLRKYGFDDARRGQQYCGANGDADVVGCPGLHIEVKRVERLNLKSAYEQSASDAREDEIPVVVHRPSRERWKVTLDFEDFLKIYRRSLYG